MSATVTPRLSGRRSAIARRSLLLAVTASPLLAASTSLAQTWNGGGGSPFNWSVGANWVGGVAPVNNGTANVTLAGSTGTVNVLDVAYSLNSLVSNGTSGWNTTGQTLTLRSSFTHTGVFNSNLAIPFALNPPTAGGTVSFTTTTSAQIFLGVSNGASPFSLGTNFALFDNANASSITTVFNQITGTGGLIKNGPGTLTLGLTSGASTSTNTFTGPTVVNAGLLNLSKPAGGGGNNFGSSIQGPLIINAGEVRLNSAEQISDSSPVTIGATGTFNLQSFVDFIGPLTVSGGAAITGSGQLTINPVSGNTVTYASGSSAVIISAPFRASSASSVNRAFQIPAAGSIIVTSAFTASGGITLNGGGSLSLNSSLSTLTSSAFNINNGTLTIAASSFTAPTFLIGSGTASGSLLLTGSSPFTNSPNITLGSAGTLTYSPASSPSTLRSNNLTLTNTSIVTLPSSGVTLALSGSLVVNAVTNGFFSNLVAPVIALGAAQIPYSVTFSGAANPIDLHSSVQGLFTSTATGGLVKNGNGIGRLLPAAGSSIGSLTVNEGTLLLTGGGSPAPLVAPGGTVTLASGTTLTTFLTNIASGAFTLNMATESILSYNGAAADTVAAIDITSATLQLNSVNLTLSATGAVITTAQAPGLPAPTLSGFTNLRNLIVPATFPQIINVTTTTNAASSSLGDFVLLAGLSAVSSGSTVTKIGPGQLAWSADNLSFGGQLNVNQGSVLLNDPSPGLNGLTGLLSVGDTSGVNTPRVTVQNAALESSLDIDILHNGTLRLLASEFISDLDMSGGSLTSTSSGTSLAISGAFTVSSPQSSTPQLSVNLSLNGNNTIQLVSGSPVSFTTALDMTSRIVTGGSPTTTVTTTGILTGRLGLTGTSNGVQTFPADLYVNNTTLDANRTGSPHLYGTVTFENNAVYRSLTAPQIASIANLELRGVNTYALVNSPASESFNALTLRQGAQSYGSGPLTVTTLTVSDPAVSVFSTIANPLTVAGATSISAPLDLTGSFSQFYGPVNISSGATVNILGNVLFRAAVNATDSTLFINGTTVESRGLFTANNAVLHLIASPTAVFYNRGTLTGTYTLAGEGVLQNTGTVVAPSNAPLDLGFFRSLSNTGLVDLAGSTLLANSASQVTNAASGTIQGPGIIDLGGNFNNAGTLLAPGGGVLNVFSGYTNSGTTRLTSPSAIVTAFFLNNTGRITGDGQLSVHSTQLITNRGIIEPSPLGQLLLNSRMTNTSAGTLSLPAFSTLVLSSVADPNAGLISLTGGTLQTLPSVTGALTNTATGRISGYGVITLPALRNQGTITFSGGTATLNADLTNDPGKTLRVQAGTALFNNPVTNNGTITIGVGGQAVFAGGGSGLPSGGGVPASAGNDNALVGGGSTTVSPNAIAQSDGLSQSSLTLLGTATSPSTVLIPSRDPAGTLTVAGRSVPQSLSVLNTLSVANDGAPLGLRAYHGLIDLADNDMVVRSGSLSDLRDLARAYLTTSGARGLGGSSSLPFTRLAVVSNDSGFGFPRFNTFDGLAVTASDILLRFTYLGDTDLSGTLDARDFNAVLSGWSNNTPNPGWGGGDLDYSGTTDAADFQLFLTAYQTYQLGGLPSLGSPLDYGNTGGGAIPEPSALSLLALPALALRRPRRR